MAMRRWDGYHPKVFARVTGVLTHSHIWPVRIPQRSANVSDAVAALHAAVERLGRAHDFRELTEGRQETGEDFGYY